MAEKAEVSIGATVKYNPHLWSKDELRAIFVARTRELADIIKRLHEIEHDKAPQHLLITGARGMGKSTLLNRIALAVKDDADLSSLWLPLVMPEEQYTISSLTELWLNVLGVLADTWELQGSHQQTLMQLDQKVAGIKNLNADTQEAAALGLLLEVIKQDGRRILLLLDSTDQLFASLGTDQTKTGNQTTGSTQLWRLRKTLTHTSELFWVGTSYQSLEVSQQYNDAFHDFFELIELRPLTLEEMRNAMLALARTFGIGGNPPGENAAAEMQSNLDAHPERLKTLRAITGGNPRTTVILYDLFAASWQEDLQSDLKALLDSMTPLYKARMENLAEQPRKILAHIMEHWAPISLGDLSKSSGIASTTLSGQLKRLELDGYIEKTRLPNTKRSGYQVSERLFNIWYLMRYTSRWLRQRLSWLIEFMRLWYSTDELRDFARSRAFVHGRGGLNTGSHLELSLAYANALPKDCRERYQLEHSVFNVIQQLATQQKQAINNIMPGLFDLDGTDQHFKTAEDYLQRFNALDEKLARCPYLHDDTEKQAWISAVKQYIYLTLSEKEAIAETAATLTEEKYRELAHSFSSTKDLENILGNETGNLLQAVALGRFFPDCPDSQLAYQQILLEFGDKVRLIAFCSGLHAAKHHDQWLEKTFQLWISLEPENELPWFDLGYLYHDFLHQFDKAETAYRQALKINPKEGGFWNNLGVLLQEHLGRYQDAEQAYRQAIALDPSDAFPWGNLGNFLANQLHRYEEAEAAYRQAIALDPNIALLWNDLANLFKRHLKRYQEAEAAYRQAIALDPKSAHPWNGLGNLLLDHLNRYSEANNALQMAQQLDPNDPYPCANRSRLAVKSGQTQQADNFYRQTVKLATKKAEQIGGIACQNLLLQAHLWLSNRDAANQALETLAHAASSGNHLAIFQLREQACESHALGLGLALSELMSSSRYADFLQPMILALRAAANEPDALEGAPAEIKVMATEVLSKILAYQQLPGSDSIIKTTPG